MATDRMWLVHKPTGKGCLLAKTFSCDKWEEYTGPRHEPYFSVQGLFDICGYDNEYEIRYESKGEF